MTFEISKLKKKHAATSCENLTIWPQRSLLKGHT